MPDGFLQRMGSRNCEDPATDLSEQTLVNRPPDGRPAESSAFEFSSPGNATLPLEKVGNFHQPRVTRSYR